MVSFSRLLPHSRRQLTFSVPEVIPTCSSCEGQQVRHEWSLPSSFGLKHHNYANMSRKPWAAQSFHVGSASSCKCASYLREGSASIQQSREPLTGNAVHCSYDFKAALSERAATTQKNPTLNICAIKRLLLLSLYQSNGWNRDGLMIEESQGVLWEVMPFFHTPSLTSKFGRGGQQWEMEHFPFSSLDPVHATYDLTFPDCSRAGVATPVHRHCCGLESSSHIVGAGSPLFNSRAVGFALNHGLFQTDLQFSALQFQSFTDSPFNLKEQNQCQRYKEIALMKKKRFQLVLIWRFSRKNKTHR